MALMGSYMKEVQREVTHGSLKIGSGGYASQSGELAIG